jgi:hypothetical protein
LHPKNNRPSEYIKRGGAVPTTGDNPISVRLSKTGLDLEDLSVTSGIAYFQLKKIFNGEEFPTENELCLLDLAFQIPQGTLSEEYGL